MAGLSLRGGMPLLKLPNGSAASVSSVLSQSYSSEVNIVYSKQKRRLINDKIFIQ